ncbi:MAG: TonB-dependent receptor [Cellvibrionaceae bacterium]|nr:TonB-dependent receptor [Cellvibrionaceae bacterium]
MDLAKAKKTALAAAITSVCSPMLMAAEPSIDEEIIVTGQKIERSLQDTKESVAVYSSQMIEERNIVSLEDVFLQTPGTTYINGTFRIRGISDGPISTPNRASLASIVVDGINYSGWMRNDGATQIWDISQVEVLRGPQSTNLGPNSLAGAVIISTQDPLYENSGKLLLGAGNYGRREYKGTANINLVDGVSAIRLAVEKSDSDGYIDNVTRNDDSYGFDNHETYRLKWLLEPNDDLRMVLSLQHIENNSGETRTILGDYSASQRVSLHDAPSDHPLEADLASLNINYQINDQWSLTSITAYQDADRDRIDDGDRSALTTENGGGLIQRKDSDKTKSQEFRVNYNGDTLRGSSGVYYSQVDAIRTTDTLFHLRLRNNFNDFDPSGGLAGLFIDATGIYPELYDLSSKGYTDVSTKNWAAFTEWEYEISEQWTLTAGLRYDREEQSFGSSNVGGSSTVLPSFFGPTGLPNTFGTITGNTVLIPGPQPVTVDMAIGLANSTLGALSTVTPLEYTSTEFDNILPQLGLSYHWNDKVSSSFFVKKSYRSGGSEKTLLNGVNEFDSEELWNYEFAHRAVIADGRGIFNTNIYYGDWTDQQVSVPEPGTGSSILTMVVNAGESEIYGIESSFEYSITPELEAYVSAAISKTEYKQFVSSSGDFSGNEFAFAPERTASAGLIYSHDNGIFFGLNANYESEAWANESNTKKVDDRVRVNIHGGVEQDNLRVEAFINNALDEVYFLTNALNTDDLVPMAIVGAPREYGLRVSYSFE